jgi:hypothetical protein
MSAKHAVLWLVIERPGYGYQSVLAVGPAEDAHGVETTDSTSRTLKPT